MHSTSPPSLAPLPSQSNLIEGVRDTLFAGGAALGILAYAGACLLLIFSILSSTHGHFVYTLDDPYIHLALAERIRSGLYGINAGEFASPSSSIIWPLLFVPFARSTSLAYLPLGFNILFGLVTVWLLALCVRKIFHLTGKATHSRVRLLVLLLVFGLNLPGLTLTGMEHLLEVMLSVCCAYGVLCLLDEERLPTWTLFAAVLLPCVRYEGLLITLAVAVSLCGVRHIRAALGLFVCSVTVPIGFGAFLTRLGLPALPLSVLLKSSANFQAAGSLPARVVGTTLRIVMATLRDPERAPELVLTFVLGYLVYRSRRPRPIFFCALAAFIVAALQTAIGPNGWFYRYELYALAFTFLLAVAVDVRMDSPQRAAGSQSLSIDARKPTGGLLITAAALALIYMQPLLATPVAALGIYEQQYQIARFTHDFYSGPVAVNDLGLVAFRRDPNLYLLDLFGLASYETARISPADRTPSWLHDITQEHHISLVAVYPEWFHEGVPADWVAVGKLCSPDAPVSAFSSRVMLYGADPGELANLRTAIGRFARTLPQGTTLELNPANAYNTCPKD